MTVKNIKIAYLLLVHKNAQLVNLFINQLLQYGDCDIYIHVDTKCAEMQEQLIKDERVFVCSKYDVRWGGFEIVKAAIELMKMVKESGRTYSHFYFGSGQDLLVKKGLYEYLSEHPQNIFLRVNREITNKDRASARYRVCWPQKYLIRNDMHFYRFVRIGIQCLCKLGIVLHRNKVIMNRPVRFYEGRTWFIAPVELLDYILNYLENNPDYIMFWEHSLASDLMFFQTIIMNSDYSSKVVDELMYVNFGKSFSTMNHPLDLTIEDDEKIENGIFFCARKFGQNQQVVEYFLNKTLENND